MLHSTLFNSLRSKINVFTVFQRYFSIPKPTFRGSDAAIAHFDQFYSSIFENWPSIRLALLSPHSYCGVANVFGKERNSTELFGDAPVFNMKDAYYLQMSGYDNVPVEHEEKLYEDQSTFVLSTAEDFPVSNSPRKAEPEDEFMPATTYKYQDTEMEDYTEFYVPNPNYKAHIVKHGVIQYPEHWQVYFYPRGKFRRFPIPKEDETNLLNYYLMDGASILPVLALDIQKGEEIGDLCASPGGKSLSILFGLQFEKIVCNDMSLSRVKRLKTVLNSYLPGTQDWSKKILVSNLDVMEWTCFDAFDKILLDVPCTNDRLSANKDANNIFHPKRFNERMRIPQIQTTMLVAALKALKPGGALVYSTCALSPLQNDGVVHMSLSKLSTETESEYVIQDLTEAFQPVRKMFQFSDVCRYGQLVVPFLPLNYGPMYIAKIMRVK